MITHILNAVRAELRLAQGIAPPIFHKIIRWDRAIPQYHVGHFEGLDRKPRGPTRWPVLGRQCLSWRGVK